MRRYHLRGQEVVTQALQQPDPRQAVTKLFAEMATRLSDPHHPPGCLQTNTGRENAARSEAVNRLNTAAVAALQAALYEVLCRAQVLGQLRPGQDPLALAQFFTTLALGLTVSGKHSGDPTVLKNTVQTALSLFEPVAG